MTKALTRFWAAYIMLFADSLLLTAESLLFISIAKSCPVAYRWLTRLDYNEGTLYRLIALLRRIYDYG